VVIVGLLSVKTGLWWGDAVAALGVSALVVWVSVQLGRRTVDALLDTAPAGMEERIAAAVSAVDGVRNCHQVRVRYSGPVMFIDLHVLVDGGQTLAEAHSLTETIEGVIQQIAPQADVTVHPEPF
jgi:cation diffusion facilitator family transporter